MKQKFFQMLFLTMFSLLFFGCSDDGDDNNQKGKAKIIFYTNSQSVYNCDDTEVNIYIDSVLIGTLSEFYDANIPPDCEETFNTVLIEKEAGTTINYYVKSTCENYKSGIWEGKIKLEKDSCYKVFLDIYDMQDYNYNNIMDTLKGEWLWVLQGCGGKGYKYEPDDKVTLKILGQNGDSTIRYETYFNGILHAKNKFKIPEYTTLVEIDFPYFVYDVYWYDFTYEYEPTGNIDTLTFFGYGDDTFCYTFVRIKEEK